MQHVSKILRQLREAATKDTVLIIIDNILPYACRGTAETESFDKEIKEAPLPLLPNYGAIGNSAYTLDITVSRLNIRTVLLHLIAFDLYLS